MRSSRCLSCASTHGGEVDRVTELMKLISAATPIVFDVHSQDDTGFAIGVNDVDDGGVSGVESDVGVILVLEPGSGRIQS